MLVKLSLEGVVHRPERLKIIVRTRGLPIYRPLFCRVSPRDVKACLVRKKGKDSPVRCVPVRTSERFHPVAVPGKKGGQIFLLRIPAASYEVLGPDCRSLRQPLLLKDGIGVLECVEKLMGQGRSKKIPFQRIVDQITDGETFFPETWPGIPRRRCRPTNPCGPEKCPACCQDSCCFRPPPLSSGGLFPIRSRNLPYIS